VHKSPAKIGNIWLIVLLITITVFHAATVRQGHIWGDDFAMYIHHAQNIVEGRPYAQTGYLFSPTSPVSPRMYPPVFPLLLAPVVRFSGLNLIPMKLEQVIFFLLALAAVCFYWQRDLGREYTLALVAILGFSPHFWAAKDNVLWDLPFLLFFYIAAVLVQRARRDGPTQWPWAVLIGIALYLAIGTRTAGIALLAGLVLYDLLKYRTITRITVVALSTCAALLLLQSHFIGSEFGSYNGTFHVTLGTVRAHLISYPRTLAGFWVASTQMAFSFFLLGVVSLLTLAGLFYRYQRGLTIVEAFLVPYAAIAILWPFFPGIRLVFPVIPWIVFLALTGLRGLTENFAPRHASAAICAFVLLISVPFVTAYRHTDFGLIRQNTGLPEFNQLCQAVREQTTPQDVLIYFRARALALYTSRAASAYNHQGTNEELWQYSRTVHATYLITTNAFDEDHGFLARYAETHSSNLELAYQNANFKLYRIVADAAPLASAKSH
jgi:4-amino-4-deoxy-L-arabinose transferase-like glycosyltransferase